MKFFNYKMPNGYDLKIGKIFRHAAVAMFLIMLSLNSYTTVSAGHVKVQTIFGKVNPQELTEGFHVVNPLADFTEYDIRAVTYPVDSIMVPSQDKLKTDMDISIIFTIVPASASDMKSNVGDVNDFITKYLKPKARSIIREVGKGYEKSQDFFLDDVQREMQERTLSGLNAFMEDKGAVIHNVLFRDVTLPKVVREAIIQTKQRQEEIQREAANLLVVAAQAQQAVKKAEAAKDAAVANASAKRTRADASAYETLTLAKADAEANKMINKTLTKDLIEIRRVGKWDGKYPTTMMGGNVPVIIGLK